MLNYSLSQLFKVKNLPHIIILSILCLLMAVLILDHPEHGLQTKNEMNIRFRNINNEKIKSAFVEVVNRYNSLHEYNITLKQQRIKSATMMAQPVFSLATLTGGVKRYEVKLGVYVRDSDTIRVDNLPKSVLIGWFAHELGHVVDYSSYSTWQMLQYGFNYLISEKFKREAEHNADIIAIEHGFTTEIIAAKQFIMENDLLDQKYKDTISKFYMSIDDVLMCAEGKAVAKPAAKSSVN